MQCFAAFIVETNKRFLLFFIQQEISKTCCRENLNSFKMQYSLPLWVWLRLVYPARCTIFFKVIFISLQIKKRNKETKCLGTKLWLFEVKWPLIFKSPSPLPSPPPSLLGLINPSLQWNGIACCGW